MPLAQLFLLFLSSVSTESIFRRSGVRCKKKKKKKEFRANLFLLLPGCSEPLGMKSGHIQDYQVTASSIFRTLNMDMFTWEPGKARLDKQGKVNAWTAGHSDQSQWLQVRYNLSQVCYLLQLL